MAVTPRTYVPLLRWRQGEYEALFRLDPVQKSRIIPLLELLPPDYDFEQRKPKKDLLDHLTLFGKRLQAKWGVLPALVDGGRLDPSVRMPDGRHPMTFVFDEARVVGASLTPVTSLERDSSYQQAVRMIAAVDGCGVALRCSLAEAHDLDFDVNVDGLVMSLGITAQALDVVLDLETPAFEPEAALVAVVIAALAGARIFTNARSVTLLATSFPDSLATMAHTMERMPRKEWLLYKAVVAAVPIGVRRPAFGDYAVASLNFAQGDMRYMRGSPNIRYAIDDAWIVVRARGAPRGSNHSYPSLCGLVIGSGSYLGPAFSAGSKYITDCHTGTATRGNPTTWKWVATNHHMTKVVDDLARLP